MQAAPSVGPEEVSAEIPVDEWERAVWYGFLPEDTVDGHIFRNTVVEENLVLYSGQGNWFNSAWEEDFCDAFVLQGGPCAHDGTVQVRNNTFAFATGALILVDRYSEEYSRIFTGNTYVQSPGGTGL